jgi:hypothetical protein
MKLMFKAISGFKIVIMKFGSKILGLLLIAALVTATLPTRSFAVAVADHAPSAALDERPADCHAHGDQSRPHSPLPHSPLPAPVSYQCCLTGHDAAVVPATSPQPPAQCQYARLTLQIDSALRADFFGGLEGSMLLSVDPPGMTPLRI